MRKIQNKDAISKPGGKQGLGDNKPHDLTTVLEDCMGDLDLLQELIRLFKQNAVEFIGGAKIFIKNADFVQLKRAAHKIKCGLSMMHTYGLYDIVVEIQEHCETDQNLDRIKYLNALFITDYLAVEAELDTAYNELANN